MGKMIAKNIWYRLALLWCGALLVTVMAQGAAPVSNTKARLAILPLQTELESTADLLSVSLGKQSNVELVERQQIKKVLHELALGGAQAQNQLKLGEVLSADGLLFLDRLKKDNREFLSLKFVAVKPGVVIHRNEIPWPLTDPVVWSGFAGEQYASLVPKLFVRKEEAIPVSLLSLQSPVITQETMALDRQLIDLLARSLSAQPNIFVLERQRLERLAFEKDWQATNESFWNGAMVIDGVVNQGGITPGKLKVNARLTPKQGQPVEVVVESDQLQLAELVDQLTHKVTQVLRTTSDKSGWNQAAEALKYAEEARWQMRWGFATEAQQAAESAWALGLHTPEMAALRVEVYSKFLINSFTRWANGMPENKVTVEHTYYSRRALDNYLEYTGRLRKSDLTPVWLKSGADLLNLVSMHLSHADLAGKRDGLKKEELRAIRERIRELAKVLEEAEPIVEQTKLIDGKIPEYPNYGFALMNYGGLWEENFSEGLKHIEKGIKAGCYLTQFKTDYRGGLLELRRTSWSEENPLICEEHWMAMLDRLQKDTNKLVRLSGYLLELKNADNDYQYEDAFLRTWQFLKENRDVLIAGELPFEAASWLLLPRSSMNMGGFMEKRMANELRPAYKKDYDQWLPARQAVQQQEKWRAEEVKFNALIARLEQLALEKKSVSSSEFLSLGVTLDLDRADRLLAAVMAYEMAVPSSPVGFFLRSRIQPVYLKAGKPMPSLISPKLISTNSKSAPVKVTKTPPPAAVKSPEKSAIRPLDLSDVPKAPKEANTNLLELVMPEPLTVRHFLSDQMKAEETGWQQWKLMDGKLWVEMWCNTSESYATGNEFGYKHYTFRFLIEVDLQSPQKQVLHFSKKGNRDDATLHPAFGLSRLQGDQAVFVRHKGKLYRMDQAKLWHETAVGQWQPSTFDLPATSRLMVVNDRLFANTADSILELVPESGELKVLASTRNKPARTLLDELPSLSPALLFSGPQGTVRAAIGDKVFQLSADGKEWRRLTALPVEAGYKMTSPNGLLFEDKNWGQRSGFGALLPYDQEIVRLLSPTGSAMGVSPRRSNDIMWRWRIDEFFDGNAQIIGALDGRDLWLLHGPLRFIKGEGATVDSSYRLSLHVPEQQYPFTFAPKFTSASRAVFSAGTAIDMLMDDQYILFVAPAASKVFVLSKSALKNLAGVNDATRKALQNERITFLEKRKKMWEKMYDANEDGKLDRAEEALMKKNSQVQKDLLDLQKLKDGQR